MADAWSMVLSNISRSQTLAEQVFGEIENRIPDLVKAFTRTDYNRKKCHLNYLGECVKLLALEIRDQSWSKELFSVIICRTNFQ